MFFVLTVVFGIWSLPVTFERDARYLLKKAFSTTTSHVLREMYASKEIITHFQSVLHIFYLFLTYFEC